MPKSEPNPDGLMDAVRQTLTKEPTFTRADGSTITSAEVPEETRAALQSQFEGFANQVASSRDLAANFDEAVRREDAGAVTQIMQEAGVSKDAEITVVEIDADMRISIRLCLWSFCISCTCSW